MYIRTVFAVGLSLAVAVAGESSAQQAAARQPTRVPVTLVLVDQLPASDGAFRVERRRVEPRDVILLRSDASRDQLADAIRTLLAIRQMDGDSASRLGAMRMRPHQTHAGPHRPFPWSGRVLADLRRAEPQDVAGVGRVRAVRIWLPRQRRRATR
ncbi:hypothetical protein SAMN05216486_10748 [bacterium JGI 053]|nr:hypothetical protein SAMN05216486_10748 [bacterium JGI 053]